MSTLINMYRTMRGSPVALVGGAIIITGTIMLFAKKVYGPHAARKRRVEAEYVADYLFKKEQQSRGVGPSENNDIAKG